MKHLSLVPRLSCVALALMLVLSAGGCAASNTPAAASPRAADMAQTEAYSTEAPAKSLAGADDTAEAGFATDKQELSGVLQTAQQGLPNRKIIKTVDIDMETLEFDTLISGLTEKTTEFGGYVEHSSVSGLGVNYKITDEYYPLRNAYVTMRVPTAKLDEFTTLIGTLGNITQKGENSEDITLTYADTEARKEALSVEYERLMALLEKAESLDAVVALEARLSEVRYELDSLSSALRRYDSLVDFSTVNVSVQEVRRLSPSQNKPETIGNRIATGFTETLLDLRDGAANVVVWLVVNLPYLLIWALIITAIVLVVLRLTKRSKAKKAVPLAPLSGFAPADSTPRADSEDTGKNKD